MDKQLETMQAQLREAERTRMAAYRPILRVEPPIALPQIPRLPRVECYQVCNIGVGAALNVRFPVHELDMGTISVEGSIIPIGAGELSGEFLVPISGLLQPALTITYEDVFGKPLLDALRHYHASANSR